MIVSVSLFSILGNGMQDAIGLEISATEKDSTKTLLFHMQLSTLNLLDGHITSDALSYRQVSTNTSQNVEESKIYCQIL